MTGTFLSSSVDTAYVRKPSQTLLDLVLHHASIWQCQISSRLLAMQLMVQVLIGWSANTQEQPTGQSLPHCYSLHKSQVKTHSPWCCSAYYIHITVYILYNSFLFVQSFIYLMACCAALFALRDWNICENELIHIQKSQTKSSVQQSLGTWL